MHQRDLKTKITEASDSQHPHLKLLLIMVKDGQQRLQLTFLVFRNHQLVRRHIGSRMLEIVVLGVVVKQELKLHKYSLFWWIKAALKCNSYSVIDLLCTGFCSSSCSAWWFIALTIISKDYLIWEYSYILAVGGLCYNEIHEFAVFHYWLSLSLKPSHAVYH